MWNLQRRTASRLAVGALVLVAAACSAHKSDVSSNLKKKLEIMGEHARKTVEAEIDREKVPPGAEAEQFQTPKILQPHEPLWVESGKSRVIQLNEPLQRISIGDPYLAGIVVLGPRTVMINAKAIAKGKLPSSGAVSTGALGVRTSTGTTLGRTLTPEPRMVETTLAIWTAGGGYDVHSLTIADFLNQQVLLEVTVAELNRTAMEEYGIDFRVFQNNFIGASFLGGGGGPNPAGTTNTIPPQGTPLLPLSLINNAPTYAFIFPNEDVSVLIEALQTEGLATVLAQPKLTALSGQNAVFQVGGEIPILIATGLTSNVEFKPFGTLVNFVPRVSDDGDILLTVNPEVSEPDFSNTVQGIPTFVTRRASTSTRLRNGQTLIIGGLLQQERTEEVDKVPYLGDLPVVGRLFRHTTYSNKLTELLVIVTPSLIHPLAPGEHINLPTDRGPLTNAEIRTKPNQADATRPRIPGLP